MSVIRVSTSELVTKVKAFSKRSKSFHHDMHVLAVSVLAHAAEHGECTPLNMFFNDALPEAYKTSFKLYVKRIMDERGYATGDWLAFKGGLFAVVQGKTEERERFLALVDELVDDKAFFDRDPISEDKVFNALELIKAVDNLVKKSKKENADLPADLVAYLANVQTDVHRLAGVPIVQ